MKFLKELGVTVLCVVLPVLVSWLLVGALLFTTYKFVSGFSKALGLAD